MTTEELIPCPFCGITPEDTGKIIICRVQTCPIQGHKIDRDSWQLRPYVEDLIAERDAFESAHEGALEDIKIIERAHASQSVGSEEEKAVLAIARDAVKEPQKIQEMMRKNKLQFTDLDQPAQKLAFTLYTIIVEYAARFGAQFEEMEEKGSSKKQGQG